MTKSTQRHKRPIRRHKSQKPRLLKGGDDLRDNINNNNNDNEYVKNYMIPNIERNIKMTLRSKKNFKRFNQSMIDEFGEKKITWEDCKKLDENFFRGLMKEYLANVRSVNKNNENVQNYIKEEVEETMEDPKITNNKDIIDVLVSERWMYWDEDSGWEEGTETLPEFFKSEICSAAVDEDEDGKTSASGGRLSRRKRKNYTKRRKRCTTTTRRRQRRKRSTKYYK